MDNLSKDKNAFIEECKKWGEFLDKDLSNTDYYVTEIFGLIAKYKDLHLSTSLLDLNELSSKRFLAIYFILSKLKYINTDYLEKDDEFLIDLFRYFYLGSNKDYYLAANLFTNMTDAEIYIDDKDESCNECYKLIYNNNNNNKIVKIYIQFSYKILVLYCLKEREE